MGDQAAIYGAIDPEPAEAYNKLVEIRGNPKLMYRDMCGETYVKMVSRKNNSTFYPDYGKYITDTRYDLWVTTAPFIQGSCTAFYTRYNDPGEVNMRLRRLLGF